MANMDISLKEMMAIDGAIGAAVVDYNSGMSLGVLGGSKDLDLQIAGAATPRSSRPSSARWTAWA